MSKALLLSSAAIWLAASAATAQVALSDHNRITTFTPGAAAPHEAEFPGTGYLYTNFAVKEKKGVYLCCIGATVSGPSSVFGAAYGIAEQFKLKQSASATTLSVGAGYASGNQSIILSLYADNGSNAPGVELASGTATIAEIGGSCCRVTSVTIPSTALSANTPYWIAVTTTGSNWEDTAFESANQVDDVAYISYTTNGGSTWGAGTKFFMADVPAIGIK